MNPPAPIPLARLRGALEAVGAAPRKRFGQHFLVQAGLLEVLVRLADIGPEDRVLEIGPGPGLLTRHLLASGARVEAVEIDPLMQAVAGQLIEPEFAGRLRWHAGDALDGTRRLGAELGAVVPACTVMVSNLPYNVSAPLLGLLVQEPQGPDRWVATIQREVAERLVAGPGTKAYGPLSVLIGLCTRARIERRVGPGAFWPEPRVESAIVVLERRSERPGREEISALEAFLALAFHNRRKTLANSVASASGLTSGQVVERLGLEKTEVSVRAEALGTLELCALARSWARHALGERDRP